MMFDFMNKLIVAPYTGAWIETKQHVSYSQGHSVAPYTGAWIETLLLLMTVSIYLVAFFMGV